jgi:hypothetical protein
MRDDINSETSREAEENNETPQPRNEGVLTTSEQYMVPRLLYLQIKNEYLDIIQQAVLRQMTWLVGWVVACLAG